MVNFDFMKTVSNLIVDFPYLLVDSFDSAMGFHYQVWYVQASFGLESMHIYDSVVYPSPLECLDDPLD